MQGIPYAAPTRDDLQALADSGANSAEEILGQLCQTVAQHVLPHAGWDGAFTGIAS
jgi:hypothetical protein